MKALTFIFIIISSALSIEASSSYNLLSEFLHTVGKLVGVIVDNNEACKYVCENGRTPVSDPNEKLHLNGCGSYGLALDTSDWPGIRSCCDEHDECYDTCGSVKRSSDQHFEKCLTQTCKSLETSILDLLNQGSYDESSDRGYQ